MKPRQPNWKKTKPDVKFGPAPFPPESRKKRIGQVDAGSAGDGFGQKMKKHDPAKAGAIAAGTQYAALCYRLTDKGQAEVLLITSRDTGRWVIPKGWPIAGRSAAASAAREAFEEAGAEGEVGEDCIGLYSYAKVMGPEVLRPCVVAVYPLRVRRMAAKFPESGQRRLRWFAPKKAAARVAEPELAELLATFAPPPEGPSSAAPA